MNLFDWRYCWGQMDRRGRIATLLWLCIVIPPLVEQSLVLFEREAARAANWLTVDDRPTLTRRCTGWEFTDVGTVCTDDAPLASVPLSSVMDPRLVDLWRAIDFSHWCAEREYFRVVQGGEPILIVGAE